MTHHVKYSIINNIDELKEVVKWLETLSVSFLFPKREKVKDQDFERELRHAKTVQICKSIISCIKISTLDVF